MRKIIEIARSGLDQIVSYPLRSLATLGCLLAMLVPYVAGSGIHAGLREQANLSIEQGADLYVSGRDFGRESSLPLRVADRIRSLEGVTSVVPRIVGRIDLGRQPHRASAVVVGISPRQLPESAEIVQGRLFQAGKPGELVVGSGLAKVLQLHVDSRLPPFYRNPQGERVSQVVGIFQSERPLWGSKLIFCSLETAQTIFAKEMRATDLLVYCRPGYAEAVARAIHHDSEFPLRAISREELAALVPGELLAAQGIFNLHFLLVFAAGIPVVLVTSGTGLAQRRREVGILKACGWQTDELLLRSLVENLSLCLLGTSLAVLIAYAWLRLADGFWIASIFLPGTDIVPSYQVPFRLVPLPALLALLVSLVMVLTGSLYTTWRTAVTPPAEAIR